MYTVYKTINLINECYYIGVHKTNNPHDSYFGSGTILKSAIKKYGKKNFKKEILMIFNNAEEAYKIESELVTKDVLNDPKCYNVSKGGIPTPDWKGTPRKILRGEEHPNWGKSDKEANKRRSEGLKRAYIEHPRDKSCWEKMAEKRKGKPSPVRGRDQSIESNVKRSLTHKKKEKLTCHICGKQVSPSNVKNHARVHSE